MLRKTLAAIALIVLNATSALASQEPSGNPKAFLRADGGRYYVALTFDPPAPAGTPPEKISAGVYRNGKLLTRTVQAGDSHGAPFTMPLGDVNALGGDPKGLMVAVGAFLVPVSLEVQAQVNSINPNCNSSALAFQIASDFNRAPTAYEAERIRILTEYVRNHPPAGETELRTERGTRKQTIRFGNAVQLPMLVARCFTLEPGTAPGSYDLKLTFPPDAPIELQPFMLVRGLSTVAHKNAPFGVDAGQVGKRAIEENLDLGVQFGSSVAKNAAGDSVRTSKASLDLRFAPLLNLMPVPDPGSNTLWFLTPFLLDMRISTGDVTRETLSQNRIVFGADVEMRHYTSPTTFPTYQRLIMSVRNASDRDFKQAEVKGVGELQLFFSRLNRPLAWQDETEASQLDPSREPKRIPKTLGVGWQVVPIVGGELGRTYKDELSIAAIEKTKNVYRAYFGGAVVFDLTRYASITVRDFLYIRGESEADRTHNYFLFKAEMPIAGFSTNTAQAIFFSYERGGQPPFSTPDVNALKLGYRLLWNGWAQQFR